MKDLREFIAGLPEKACDMPNKMVISPETPIDKLCPSYVDAKKMAKMRFECGAAGCFLGWAYVRESLKTGKRVAACDGWKWLGLNGYEGNELFYSFPNATAVRGGWKKWMLRRLDNIIRAGRVTKLRLSLDD